MKYRKLRIAFSAVCLTACVLLFVLWVWSYRWASGATVYHQYIKSIDKHLYFDLLPGAAGVSILQFDGKSAPRASGLAAPCWFLVPLSATLAIAPWIRWRFSLGALIIAVTLVAAVLGSVAYLLRN
jgi:hypothetical protein